MYLSSPTILLYEYIDFLGSSAEVQERRSEKLRLKSKSTLTILLGQCNLVNRKSRVGKSIQVDLELRG